MTPAQAGVLDKVRRNGFTIVATATDEGLSFAYTVGLHEHTGWGEVVLFGLAAHTALAILSEFGRRTKEGERFVAGGVYCASCADSRSSCARCRPSASPNSD